MSRRRSSLPPPLAPAVRRVVVVGVTGSGKTTMARDIARRLGTAAVELDALHWGPNWTEAPVDVFRQRTSDALAGDSWVVDGNYRRVRDIVWPRAQAVVWLDYPFWIVARRLVGRTFRRARRREVLWHGNRERLWVHFLHRDSLFLWLLKTYWKVRREYSRVFGQPEYEHLVVVRLRSPRDAAGWLESMDGRASAR